MEEFKLEVYVVASQFHEKNKFTRHKFTRMRLAGDWSGIETPDQVTTEWMEISSDGVNITLKQENLKSTLLRGNKPPLQ